MTSTVNNKLSDISNDIQNIFKKLSKLENYSESITQKLTNEIIQRQNLEKHTITTQEAFEGQLQALKDTTDHFEDIITTSMDKTKLNILEEVQKKNTKLIQLIETTMTSEKYNNEKESNSNNTNRLETCEREYYSSKQVDEKIANIQKYLENEFNQYRTELNENVLKIGFIEKKMYELFEQNQNDFNSMKKELISLKKEINSFQEYKRTTNQNLVNYQKELLKNDDNINEFKIKINTLITELEGKLSTYEQLFDSQNKNFNQIKEDIYGQIQEMNLNSGAKLQNANEELDKKLLGFHKEIDNFEDHMLNEHKKFIEYIQNHWEEQNGANRKLYDYITQDVDLIKSKNDTLENLMKKLRADVFKSLNDSEEFLEKKYESIFRIINK